MHYIHELNHLDMSIPEETQYYHAVIDILKKFDYADILKVAVAHPDLFYMALWIDEEDNASAFHFVYLPHYLRCVPKGAHPLAIEMCRQLNRLVYMGVLPRNHLLPIRRQDLKGIASSYLIDQLFKEQYRASGKVNQWIESPQSVYARAVGIYQTVTATHS